MYAKSGQDFGYEDSPRRGGQPGNRNHLTHGNYATPRGRRTHHALAPVDAPTQRHAMPPLPQRQTLRPSDQKLLRSFDLDMKGEGKQPNTLQQYSAAVHNFLLFCKDRDFPRIEEIARGHISLWLQYLREERNYAPASVRNRYMALKAFFKWCVQQQDETGVERHPMSNIPVPKAPKMPKDVVSVADMERLFQHLEKKRRWRDAAVISVLYETGIRATELTNIRPGHCDLDGQHLLLPTFDASTPEVHIKNDEWRVVAISAKVVRYIDRYLREPRRDPQWLFNSRSGKLTRHTVWDLVQRCFAEIGVTGSLHIGAHDMRHTSATHRARTRTVSTQDLQDIYGWNDPKMAAWYTQQARKEIAVAVMRENSLMDRLNMARPQIGATGRQKRLQ